MVNSYQLTQTKPTGGSIKFYDGYLTFRLPWSKTDKADAGVNIPMTASNDAACPVPNMKLLRKEDLQHDNQPVFRLNSGPFDMRKVLQLLNARFNRLGLSCSRFSGHSFRRGAAQDAHNQ
jgi:hypothetical protein